MRGSCDSASTSGCSSRHGAHQDAHTFTSVTRPLKSDASRPGTGWPSRGEAGERWQVGRRRGWPMRADGIVEGSAPSSRRVKNSAANPAKTTSGMSTARRKRRRGGSGAGRWVCRGSGCSAAAGRRLGRRHGRRRGLGRGRGGRRLGGRRGASANESASGGKKPSRSGAAWCGGRLGCRGGLGGRLRPEVGGTGERRGGVGASVRRVIGRPPSGASRRALRGSGCAGRGRDNRARSCRSSRRA